MRIRDGSGAGVTIEKPREESASTSSNRAHAEFQALYEEHFGSLVERLVSEAGSEEAAENAVQQTFTELLDRSLREGRLPAMDNPFKYLLDSSRNQVLRAKRKSHRARSLDNAGSDGPRDREAEDAVQPASKIPDPDQHSAPSLLAHEEDLKQVLEARQALTERDRQILDLYINGIDPHEIASRMGMEVRTVQKVVETARKKIRQELSPLHSSLPGAAPQWTPRTRESAAKAIELTPKPYRDVLHAKYILGESPEETARTLRISLAAYSEYLDRGHEILAKNFGFRTPEDLAAALKNSRG